MATLLAVGRQDGTWRRRRERAVGIVAAGRTVRAWEAWAIIRPRWSAAISWRASEVNIGPLWIPKVGPNIGRLPHFGRPAA